MPHVILAKAGLIPCAALLHFRSPDNLTIRPEIHTFDRFGRSYEIYANGVSHFNMDPRYSDWPEMTTYEQAYRQSGYEAPDDIKDLPVGLKPAGATGPIFSSPRAYVLSLTNQLLGNQRELVVFQSVGYASRTLANLQGSITLPSPEDERRLRLGELCQATWSVPWTSAVAQGNSQGKSPYYVAARMVLDVDEQKELQKSYENLENLLGSIPVAGSVFQIERGCFAKETNCAEAVISAIADGATLAVPVTGALTDSVSAAVWVRRSAAMANATAGAYAGFQSIQDVSQGAYAKATGHALEAVFRVTSAAEFVIEAQTLTPSSAISQLGNGAADALSPSEEEKAAISKMKFTSTDLPILRDYQGDGYRKINAILRGTPIGEAMTPAEISDLRTEANKLVGIVAKQEPLGETVRVFRGAGITGAAPKVGDVFEAKGMVSTSFDEKVAEGFAKKQPGATMVAEIEIGPEAHGFAMNSLGASSIYPKESEFLLARGAQFKVVSSAPSTIKTLAGSPIIVQKWRLVADGTSLGKAADVIIPKSTKQWAGTLFEKFFSPFEADFEAVSNP